MKLTSEELSVFGDVWNPLIEFAYRKRTGNPKAKLYGTAAGFTQVHPTADYLYENRNVIDEYLAHAKVSDSTRTMLLRWQKYARSGIFFILGVDQGDALWMSSDGMVWRVRSLMDDWKVLFRGEKPPLAVKGTILPFRDTLISDGLLRLTPLRDPESRSSMTRIFETAKQDGTIFSTIPWMEPDPEQTATRTEATAEDRAQEETATVPKTEVRYHGGLKTMRKGRKKKPSDRR